MAELLRGSGGIAELQRGGSKSDEGKIARSGFRWIPMESDDYKSIYIRFNEKPSFEESESQWYVIPVKDLFFSYPPATEPEPERTLSPAPIPRMTELNDCTSVFLYPRIYVIGGLPTRSATSKPGPLSFITPTGGRTVYSYDITASPYDGHWQEIKPMEAERANPCVFVMDEKIYVFGGLNCSCCLLSGPDYCYATKPLLEIYNPRTETWEARLHGGAISIMPPCLTRLSPLFLDKSGHRHVLLHTGSHSLRTYDIDSDFVTTHGLTFMATTYGTSAVVDGILFCYYDLNITGYDMEDPDWPGLRLYGLTWGKELPGYHDFALANLLNIGGSRLAILWNTPRIAERDFLLSCSVVKVHRTYRNGAPGLHAVVESFKTYSFSAIGGYEMDCLAF